MRNDPIVEEMRARGQEFAAEHRNNIRRICEALRELEAVSGRKVVRREPKRMGSKKLRANPALQPTPLTRRG